MWICVHPYKATHFENSEKHSLLWSGVPDVITHAKFCISRLRGFLAAAARKWPFPIPFWTTLRLWSSYVLSKQNLIHTLHNCQYYILHVSRVYRCSSWKPKYVIENAERQAIFTIDGPCCPCQCICCPRDIEFPVSARQLLFLVASVCVSVCLCVSLCVLDHWLRKFSYYFL